MNRTLNKFLEKYDKNFYYICLLNNDNFNFVKSNPSILFNTEKRFLFINYREINYLSYFSKNQKYKININGWLSNDKCTSKNVIGAIQGNVPTSITKEININVNTAYKYSGLEDAILTKWDNSIYLCGTRCDINGIGKFCIYKIDEKYKVVEETIINDEMVNNSIEKHWSPIEDKPFTFIRWCNPTQIVKVEPVTGKILNVINLEVSKLTQPGKRGNCQTVKYKDGYLSIVHDTRQYINLNSEFTTVYKHYFIQYDNNFKIVRISKPFNFEVDDIEFCCGLQINKGKVYVSYSVYDTIPYLIIFDESTLDKIFENIEEFDDININDIYERGNKFLEQKQFCAAAACFSRVFSDTDDKELEYKSLLYFCICLLYIKYMGLDLFSNENLLFFINKLIELNDEKAEPYYLSAIYYGLLGEFDKKEFYYRQSFKYKFELPEIKRYLKIW